MARAASGTAWTWLASPLVCLAASLYALAAVEAVAQSRLNDDALLGTLISALALAALLLAVWRVARCPAEEVLALPRLAATVALGPAILAAPAAVAVPGLVFGRHGYAVRWEAVAVVAVAAAVTLWLLVRADSRTGEEPRRAPPALVAGLLATALLGRLAAMASYPLDPAVSDMLPAIREASLRWLGGEAPYGRLELGTHWVPLAYFPLTWLPFSPLAAAGADLRWLGHVGALAIAVWLNGATFRPPLGRAMLAGCFALSPLLLARYELYLTPAWAVVALVVAALSTRRWWAAPAAAGLGLATQQLFVLVVPSVVGWLRHRYGWREAVLGGALAVAIGVAVVLPFAAMAPEAFLYGVWGQYHRGQLELVASGQTTQGLVSGLNVHPALAPFGLVGLAAALQIVAAALLSLGGLAWSTSPWRCALWCALVTAGFLLFNYPSWSYLWVSMWLLVAGAALLKGTRAGEA